MWQIEKWFSIDQMLFFFIYISILLVRLFREVCQPNIIEYYAVSQLIRIYPAILTAQLQKLVLRPKIIKITLISSVI